jgi:hypothetical protein
LPFGLGSAVLRAPLSGTISFFPTIRAFAVCTKVNDVSHAQSLSHGWAVAFSVSIDGKCADRKAFRSALVPTAAAEHVETRWNRRKWLILAGVWRGAIFGSQFRDGFSGPGLD